MRVLKAPFVATILVLTGACYRYVPTESTAVPPGARIRALLTEDGVEEMRGIYGPNVNYVEGPLVGWSGEGLGVLAELEMRRPGFPATTLTDTIQLLPNQYSSVEVRQLDGKRTAGFTVVILGGMTVAALGAKIFGGTSEEEPPGPPEPEAAIVFLRIPLRIGGR